MCHILVVDDEADTRKLFKLAEEYFFQRRRQSWRFLYAANSEEALGYLADHPEIEIVLTDLMMTPIDGFELMSIIKEKYGDTKLCLAISAFQDMPNIRKAMNGGAFDFLTKPYNLEDIMATIDKAITYIQRRNQVAQLLDQALRIVQFTDQHIARIKKKSDTIRVR